MQYYSVKNAVIVFPLKPNQIVKLQLFTEDSMYFYLFQIKIKMAGRPKRESKAPKRFQVWENGDKHEPFKIRNQKKEMKVEIMKKKEYQAEYREKKKVEKKKETEIQGG